MEEETMKILGHRLLAKEFDELMAVIEDQICKKLIFDKEIRIVIQNFAEMVGNEKSGTDFENYLNDEIAPLLASKILNNS